MGEYAWQYSHGDPRMGASALLCYSTVILPVLLISTWQSACSSRSAGNRQSATHHKQTNWRWSQRMTLEVSFLLTVCWELTEAPGAAEFPSRPSSLDHPFSLQGRCSWLSSQRCNGLADGVTPRTPVCAPPWQQQVNEHVMRRSGPVTLAWTEVLENREGSKTSI